MHRSLGSRLTTGIFFALSTMSVEAVAALADAGGAHVRFTAVGPAGMKIAGDGSQVTAREVSSRLVIAVPLAQLHTGIGLRDSHMREKYLEVSKFPEARLSVARDSLKLPAEGATSEGDAAGELSLHGRTKPVKFHYRVKLGGGVYRVSGALHLDMTDYGIEAPSYLGVSVKPGVDVDIEFQAKDR